MKTFESDHYYAILQISPNAGSDEIRHAYRQALALYDEESVATYALFSDPQRQRLLAAIENAFETLIDDERRDAYDQIKAEIQKHPDRVGYLINMLLVSRHLERLADHATNIAEEVVYLVEAALLAILARRVLGIRI